MGDDALAAGRPAVVTGAASGIGLALCRRLAGLGMKICMVDQMGDRLEAAARSVRETPGAGEVLATPMDVAVAAEMQALAERLEARWGDLGLLVNNAATRVGGGVFAPTEDWRSCFEVNFWGVINGVDAFAPAMIARSAPSRIVTLGSKQGITNPPGNAAYNATKAALKSYAESLEHELRNTALCRVKSHLLIPGWTTTGDREHKPGAWLPEQVVERLLERMEAGDFYMVCPDNEVTAEMDRERILWGAQDITENRAPLSRWHEGWKAAFADYARKN